MSAMRFNKNKLRIDLVPPQFMVEIARVFTVGAAKYKDNNWKKGLRYSEVLGSMQRHILQFQMGVNVDPDTKCHHMTLAAWNALVLVYMSLNQTKYREFDDREHVQVNEDFTYASFPQVGMTPTELIALEAKYTKERVDATKQ